MRDAFHQALQAHDAHATSDTFGAHLLSKRLPFFGKSWIMAVQDIGEYTRELCPELVSVTGLAREWVPQPTILSENEPWHFPLSPPISP